MFYEIIYETGNHSLASYDSDDEAMRAVSEHHRRATSGERAQESNPQMGPAERIAKVLKYKEHPATLNESQAVDAVEVKKAVNDAIERLTVGNLVSIPELESAVREITSPLVESPPHESNYKMEDNGQLDPNSWDNTLRGIGGTP